MTLRLNGSSSGYTEIDAPAAAGSNTLTLPTGNGSANQFFKNGSTAGELEYSSMVETTTGVGIGTSSPDANLKIQPSDSDNPANAFAVRQNNAADTAQTTFSVEASPTDGVSRLISSATSTPQLAFYTGGSESMRIAEDGNVGIGETDPTNSLHIRTSQVASTSDGTTPGINVVQTGGTAGNGNYGAGINFSKIDSGRPGGSISSIQTGADPDLMGLSFFTSQSSSPTNAVVEQFRIRSDGQLFGSDTSISSFSDQRLKENINSFSYSLDTFKLLQPKVFDWKNPELHGDRQQQRGFVAQDIESVDSYWLDEYSVNTESADAEYLDEDRVAKTSKLGQKDAMYVSVIQQLLSKIETLETKVAALEAGS